MSLITASLSYTDASDVSSFSAVGLVTAHLTIDRTVVSADMGGTIALEVDVVGVLPAGAVITPNSEGGGTFSPATLTGPGTILFTAPLDPGAFNITFTNNVGLVNPHTVLAIIGDLVDGVIVPPPTYSGARAPIRLPKGDLELIARGHLSINPQLFRGFGMSDVKPDGTESIESELRKVALYLIMLGVVEP